MPMCHMPNRQPDPEIKVHDGLKRVEMGGDLRDTTISTINMPNQSCNNKQQQQQLL